MAVEFPFPLTPFPEEVQAKIKAKFLGFRNGLVDVGGRHALPAHYGLFASKYFNYKFQEDDVLVMTFPRSGTTWTQEVVWTMRNKLDLDTAAAVPLDARVPFIELDSIIPPHASPPTEVVEHFRRRHPGTNPKGGGVYLDLVDALGSPRTIKTHLPFSVLSPDLVNSCKVVYVARNPKDVAVSFYHQQRLVKSAEYVGSFREYILDFWCQDHLLRAPYWSHLAEGWARRHHPNVLFLFYEDMKEDFLRELGRLNSFLETGLTESQLLAVAHHASFSGMKSRGATNPTAALQEAGNFKKGEADFIRKGITGDWTNFFTPDLEEKFEEWMEKWQPTSREIPFKYHIEKEM
ncbi:sulfotransferase 1 family member D1-like [Penaeus monodon]|uniref:sulfotransferase 1 family member D1-like n=1 Tax=Penaeus monodon TaxID=6687 RepID=UPI0018A71AC4|nr:sulfotransferase 1 family member D1-like [Penaeus monodon]